MDDHFGPAAMVISQLPGCRTKVRAPCGCGGRGGKGNLLIKALAFAASNFSFPEGTEVLTPDGPVAIETLREGDLVIARNEDTGVFPVSAVMGRQASEVLWLTLENTEGEVTRMGVTPTHPLFIVEAGWGEAGALVPGDAIRDKDLQALTVLAVEVDTRPQMVHNLEIADAHTYFAGELEAWGHNGFGYYVLEFASGNFYVGKGCPKRMRRSIREKEKGYGDTLAESKWYPADGNAASFIGEHLEM